MTALQDYTRLKRQAPGRGGDLAWSLVLDGLVFGAEAEIRWLDRCEARVRRAALEHPELEEGTQRPSPDPVHIWRRNHKQAGLTVC